MPTVYRLLDAGKQFFDDNGDPYNAGKLFTYIAGSSTKKTTYQDSAGATPHSNPIVLGSDGRLPAPVWGTTGAYKLILAPSTDTDPPAAAEWTENDISGINDTASSSIDQWVASGLTPTYVSATSFTVPGDQTTLLHVGRRLKTTNTGGTVYSYISASVFGALTTVTVVNDSGTLDSGLSAVSYGLLSYTNPSIWQGTSTLIGLLELATNAEALAGSDTARAVTSAGLASDKTKANTGHFVLPGAVLVNWAQVAFTAATGPTTANWTKAFSGTPYVCTVGRTLDVAAHVNVSTFSTTQVGITLSAAATGTVYVIAIGPA